MEGLGALLPLTRDPSFGTFALLTNYRDKIRQNFKNLLLTSPGERVMNTDFGVGLRRYLFESYADAKYGLRQRIETQTRKYMPYITVHNVIFDSIDEAGTPLEERNILSIRVVFSVPDLNFESVIIVDHEATA